MPLVVGHALLGASVVAATTDVTRADRDCRRMLFAGAILGVAPDLDLFFTWILGMGIRWHGGFTHSIIVAVVVGSLTAWLMKNTCATGFWTRSMVLSGAMLSHGILDWATKKSFEGTAFFWPFNKERYELKVFDYFAFYPDSKLDPLWKLALRAVEISLYELMIFGSLMFLVVKMRRSWDDLSDPTTEYRKGRGIGTATE